MLRNREEIENYEEKSKALKENGWETWYHPDNWIRTEWYDQGIRIDYAGVSTDEAYSYLKKSEG